MAKKKDIKVLFCDVDGTLTDGSLYFSANGEMLKVFHVKDGHGIKEWIDSGRVFVVVTSRESEAVRARCRDLGIQEVHCGINNKQTFLEHWLKEHGFTLKQSAYIGDDVNDLAAMKQVRISACPADAIEQVQNIADYICDLPGGKGAVREFIDYLLKK